MIRNAADTVSFFGGHEIVSDDGIPLVDSTVGSIEGGCHTGMHLWVGNSDTPNNEDMGSLLSAGYDPLFYVHHANVDRMWTLWNQLRINEIVNVHVPRPANHKFNLSTKEMLIIDKVKYNLKKLVKFNIIVNGCDEHLTTITPRDSEYAGCFTKIPETLGDERFEDSGVKLELSELLKETQCDNKDYILLTFVPILGCDDVEIASIKIEMTDISQKD
ncbi:AChain A, aurone synthase [Tanacetum coccineum]